METLDKEKEDVKEEEEIPGGEVEKSTFEGEGRRGEESMIRGRSLKRKFGGCKKIW